MSRLAQAALAVLSLSLVGARAPDPAVRLWRLDCGSLQVSNLDEYEQDVSKLPASPAAAD